MAYGPVKVMSEFQLSANFAGGGAFATSLRFHSAWPASLIPARRPTRGSGIAELDLEVAVETAHPAAEKRIRASANDRGRAAVDRTETRLRRDAKAMKDYPSGGSELECDAS